MLDLSEKLSEAALEILKRAKLNQLLTDLEDIKTTPEVKEN